VVVREEGVLLPGGWELIGAIRKDLQPIGSVGLDRVPFGVCVCVSVRVFAVSLVPAV